MSTALTALIVAVSLGQPLLYPEPTLPNPGQMPQTGSSKEIVEVVAVKALADAAPYMDDALKPFEQALRKLPYKSFTLIAQREQEVPYGHAVLYPVNDDYATYVTLQGQTEDGQVALDVQIELTSPGEAVNAVHASGQAARGKALIFRGLELPDGEMVVLLRIKQPDQNQQQQQNQENQEQSEQEQQQNQQQQQQQQQQQEQDEQQQQDQQQQQQMAQNDDQQQNSESEMSQQESEEQMENIEAILESLREIDRKEQKQSQNRRSRVIVSGDWW